MTHTQPANDRDPRVVAERTRTVALQRIATRHYLAGPSLPGPLVALWSIADADDPYGDAADWLFVIADTLFHGGATVPASWEFTHGAGSFACADSDYWPRVEVAQLYRDGACGDQDLIDLGNWLAERLDEMKAAGMDR